MIERRAVQLAQDGGRIHGTLIAYGEETRREFGREVFTAGAFGDVSSLRVRVNMQHDRGRPIAVSGPGGGLTLSDSPSSLDAVIEPVDTRDGREAVTLVRAGIMSGLSLEFRADAEKYEGDLRIIDRATLGGLGLVDVPQYAGSGVSVRAGAQYEVRQAGGGISGAFAYGKLAVSSNRGARRKEMYLSGSLDFAIKEASREISLLASRDTNSVIASKLAGNLTLNDTPEALRFTATGLAETAALRDLRAQLAAGIPTSVLPFALVSGVENASEVVQESALAADGIEGADADSDIEVLVYRNAVLTSLALLPRPYFPDATVTETAPPTAGRQRRFFL